MTQIKLRTYQEEAVAKAISFYMTVKDASRNPIEVLPTGAGKSIISAEVFNRLSVFPSNSFMLLTHSSELVKQNAEKIRMLCPNRTVGIYSAALGAKDTKATIICGTIQSVYKRLKSNPSTFGRRSLLVIDEAHLLSSKENSMYRIAINALKRVNPNLRLLGLSATPYRLDCGLLTDQEDAIFTDMCYDLSEDIPMLIEQGYLAPLRTLPTPLKHGIDLSKVRIIGGDFNSSELDMLFNQDAMLNEACNIMIDKGKERKAWLVFVSGIASAMGVSELLNKKGIRTEAVHSKRPKEENTDAIQAFRDGTLQCLVSADQLTTGFDVPKVDFIGMLRPTMSPSLHVQMLGRGMRPCKGKIDCLVLDFVQNLLRLGPVNRPHIPAAKDVRAAIDTEDTIVSNEPREVQCPSCGCSYSSTEYLCPECGALRMTLPQKMDLNDLSSGVAIDYGEGQQPKHMHRVLNMVPKVHKAKSGRDCLRIDFVCQGEYKPYHILAFLNFDMQGRPYKEACKLWGMLKGQEEPPQSTAEAGARLLELKIPKEIDALRRAPSIGRQFDIIKGALFQ